MDALLHFRHFPALLQGEMNCYLRELKRLAHLGCDKQATWAIASKVFDNLLKIDQCAYGGKHSITFEIKNVKNSQ